MQLNFKQNYEIPRGKINQELLAYLSHKLVRIQG